MKSLCFCFIDWSSSILEPWFYTILRLEKLTDLCGNTALHNWKYSNLRQVKEPEGQAMSVYGW